MTAAASPSHEVVIETDRLLLRPWRVAEAAVQRELWTERDPRVPPHRRIDPDGHPTVAELELLRRVWSQGYATEASSALLEWARSSGYERLWATVREWNVASRRVLAKIGFTETERTEADPLHGTILFLTRRL